jgi:hypothetical protein
MLVLMMLIMGTSFFAWQVSVSACGCVQVSVSACKFQKIREWSCNQRIFASLSPFA